MLTLTAPAKTWHALSPVAHTHLAMLLPPPTCTNHTHMLDPLHPSQAVHEAMLAPCTPSTLASCPRGQRQGQRQKVMMAMAHTLWWNECTAPVAEVFLCSVSPSNLSQMYSTILHK